ncbi:MAG: thioredoxin fold domain-containing protein [Cyanothece sp. SIO1E1]|nr:thioredoxin fold domain-containing protein [Cyanothece sp. SIO1E1]
MAANSSDSLPSSEPKLTTGVGHQVRNLLIVLVAIVLSVAIFLGVRTQSTSVSLTALAEASTPVEVALSNGKPSLIEFYANWCTTCQAMAADMGQLETRYADQVNFVMLNVDNSKWLPEMVHYRVDGIPHFVFLDPAGTTIATTIGEQPRSIMTANLEALVAGESLPYAQTMGQMSELETSVTSNPSSTDPRSHGGQVVN